MLEKIKLTSGQIIILVGLIILMFAWISQSLNLFEKSILTIFSCFLIIFGNIIENKRFKELIESQTNYPEDFE